ncbi:sensor protein FixL [Geobacter sp. OR-1]|uniref:PAS domain-containing sensor histidine kinase n=1 Tax=Geobacter sp. OR-1 TaxID=1266765 RepID=UPI00054226DF|nr:PAS domain-containing sensor histidine kinase [Geobacter sp. OR-1]GAM10070.1 sensor protein FixL [Geobacter sp. OR-1]
MSMSDNNKTVRGVLAAKAVVLLLIVFVAELAADRIIPGILPCNSALASIIADTVILICFSAPFIWWLVFRPLQTSALVTKAQFQHLFSQMVDAIIILDDKRCVTSCNPMAESIFGVSADTLVGRPVNEVIDFPADCFMPTEPVEKISDIENVVEHLDCFGTRRDGSKIPLSVSASKAKFDARKVTVLIIRDMTQAKNAEHELKKSEARFRNLADNAPVGIFETNANGDCIFVNKKWCQIAGISPEKAFGRGWATALHPEDAVLIAHEWYGSVEGHTPFLLEYRFRTPEGNDNWVLGSASALKGEDDSITGYMGIIIDINERKKTEKELQESEERFRSIFEQTEDAIVLFAPGSCAIIDVNTTTEKLYGYSREQLIGMGFNVFKSEADYQGFIHAVCMLKDEQTCQLGHVVNLCSDGEEIHVSVRAKVIKLQGHDAIFCSLRDITQRLRMEEEARSIQSQLIHTNKMASLGLLVAGIAHEINNPNNYIMANAQMLDKIWRDLEPILRAEEQARGDFILGGLPYSRLEGALPEMISAINDGSRRIKTIIGELKNYSRQGQETNELLDLNRVISSSMLLLTHHVRKYTDNFIIRQGESLPAILGNSHQLEQVVINLIMNALQALTSKEQEVSVTTSYSDEKGMVCLTVSDAGSGIQEGVQERIMEPFFTTRLDTGGTGLGLSITRSIVMAHQGKIEVDSRPGEGTTVSVYLPVVEDE